MTFILRLERLRGAEEPPRSRSWYWVESGAKPYPAEGEEVFVYDASRVSLRWAATAGDCWAYRFDDREAAEFLLAEVAGLSRARVRRRLEQGHPDHGVVTFIRLWDITEIGLPLRPGLRIWSGRVTNPAVRNWLGEARVAQAD